MNVATSSGGRRGRAKARAVPEMNVTPLVDVVLVLLIIFMVVTPLLTKQFWIHLPTDPKDATPPPAAAQAPLVVSVDAQGRARLNREVVPDAELAVQVRRVLAARGDRTVFFDATDDAPFGAAMRVLDLARGAGAATIAVSTESIAER